MQNSLCVQVLRSPILAALLHGTGALALAVADRQTLRRGTRNGITELLLLVIFNRGRHLYSEGGHHDVAHQRPDFSRCLAVSCAGTLYIHFRGLLPPDRIFPGTKFTLRPRLAFSYIGSVTAWHGSCGHQPNFAAWYKEWNYETLAEAPPIFGRAAITLGIGPHSSFEYSTSV